MLELDMASLLSIQSRYTGADLDRPLANRMSLMQLAVHCGQAGAARWLADHRDSLPDMRLAAVKKADEYPWQRYTDRILSALTTSLQSPEGATHE